MVAALAEVRCARNRSQTGKHWASSENVGSTWFMRRHGARRVHPGHLREHRVCEELDLPQGVKPLSIHWVDKDDCHTAKARLTRGHEQELTGQENFNSATPQPATLRLLVMAQALGLAVAVGDCAQAFLQAPLLEKNEVRVSPPEAEVKLGRAWRLLKTLPGLPPGATTQRKSRKSAMDWSRAREIPVYTAMCVSACGPCVTWTTA